jgi:hypothetical protein
MTISIDKSIEKEKENVIQPQKRQPTYEINPLILNRWSPRSIIGGGEEEEELDDDTIMSLFEEKNC